MTKLRSKSNVKCSNNLSPREELKLKSVHAKQSHLTRFQIFEQTGIELVKWDKSSIIFRKWRSVK